ncbi:MAG TPA: acyl-CoA dehydrogenase family protein [Aldersonia sp.]
MNPDAAERTSVAQQLRAVVRGFLTARVPSAEARRFLDPGQRYDATVWSTMADQLGLPSLAIAEEYGGAGAGWREVAVVAEEMGRALLPSAYFASVVLAAGAIAAAKDDAMAHELLPRLASGRATATLAALDDDGRWDHATFALTATDAADGYRLSGTKTFVFDGRSADVVVVAARTELGASLFVVDGASPGLTRTPLPTLDPTRPQARLEFTDVSGRLLGVEGQAEPALARTFDLALLAAAADALGGADRCLQMAVDYAKERVAFGRPIGGFQAIKHNLVDLYLEVEFARVAVEQAAQAADSAQFAEFSMLASLAFAQCAQTYALVATENIHIHGGIGFTWEHDAQLFFRRAKSTQVLFGDTGFHHERVAAYLLGRTDSVH